MLTIPVKIPPETEARYVTVTRHPQALLVRPVGPRLGEQEAGILSQVVDRELESFPGRLKWLVLDIREIHLMTSVALGVCIELRKRVARGKARMMMFGATPELTTLLKTVRAQKIFVLESDEAALERALNS